MTTSLPPRRLILLSGPQDWGKRAASALITSSGLKGEQYIWLDPEDSTLDLLGQERALVIIDAYRGLNPDVLGRVSGLVQAGGALLIICPEWDVWACYADPELGKIAPYPLQASQLHSQYIQRFVRILKSFDGIERYLPENLDRLPTVRIQIPENPLSSACTADQQRALDAIIKTASGQRRRPVFLKAHRGRGKSAALGLAAGQLIAQHSATNIMVTARSQNQLASVFKHAHAVLPEALISCDKKTLNHHHARLRYIPVDSLIKKPLKCNLLIVDDASALGVAKLEALLMAYPRIAFAGTEHGYEGSGRGFSLKFKQLIQRYSRGHIDIELDKSVRWADDDPLEYWVNRLLLLDIDQREIYNSGQHDLDDLTFQTIEPGRLARNESLLKQVFGLLIDAHYQTRPIDCRQLLDAPNSRLFAAYENGQILGVVWLMFEGALGVQMARDIVSGRRRPQGHRAPQILAAHLGLDAAVSLRCARIQRIVVQPQAQKRGIGSWMLKQLKCPLKDSIDYLASSFGADIPLAQFWRRAGFTAVRVSDRALASSGLRSAVFVKALTPASLSMLADAKIIFAKQFVSQLADGLGDLDPELAFELAPKTNARVLLTTQEIKAAVLFAYGNRPFESSLAALRSMSKYALMSTPPSLNLDQPSRKLFISRLLQHHTWAHCARNQEVSGRNQGLALLKRATRKVLNQCCSDMEISRLRALYGIDAPE